MPAVVQVIVGGLLLAATTNHPSSPSWQCQAWAPPSLSSHQQQQRHRPSTTRLYEAAEKSSQQEAVLRKEIAQRNSVLPKKDEERYAIADGEFLEKLNDVELIDTSVPAAAPFFAEDGTDASAPSSSSRSSAAARIERLTKPRAYPLFLAEKAAELVEATVADFAKTFHLASESPYSSYQESSSQQGPNGSRTNGKERVVILGTGWGAASFLKAIDTEQHDVTVISPRNYFVFTPMLAGASVGTVEYRSITEPCVPRCLIRNGQRHACHPHPFRCLTHAGFEKSTERPSIWRPPPVRSILRHGPLRASRSCATGTRAR
jgi:hypothetical protein